MTRHSTSHTIIAGGALLAVWAFCFLVFPVEADVAAPDAYPVMEALYGPLDVATVCGNGRLTAGVNSRGRVMSCLWPSPGYFGQLSYRTVSRDLPALGTPPHHGAMWAIEVDGRVRWLFAPPWQPVEAETPGDFSPVIVTKSALAGTSLEALQEVFVHPERDLLSVRVLLRGATARPKIFWYANWTPCTRLVPELPAADWLMEGTNDFAAFADVDGERIYHFRPAGSRAADWARAASLSEGGALPSAWAVFDAGTWLVSGSPNILAGFQCGLEGGDDAPHAQVEAGRLGGGRSCVGACASAMELVPTEAGTDGGYTGTVFVAFGNTKKEADSALDYAVERGFDLLAGETEAHWEGLLEGSGAPLVERPECKQALAAMVQAVDSETGAIARAPISPLPLALDWPRYGAWVTLALDRAGFHALAGKHSFFYVQAIREEDGRGKPRGSLPAACYADGREAAPHLVLDAGATAWMISAILRHALILDESDRKAYLAPVWEPVSLGADFLAGWSRGGNAPFPAYDAAKMRDADTVGLHLEVFMGLDSAIQIAQEAGQDPKTDWLERRRDLESLIRFDLRNPPADESLDVLLLHWLKEVVTPENPILRVPVDTGEGPVQLGEMGFPVSYVRAMPRAVAFDSYRASLEYLAAPEEGNR